MAWLLRLVNAPIMYQFLHPSLNPLDISWKSGNDLIIYAYTDLCMQIPCLCGSGPCLLCRCCPSGNNSTVTRLIYAFFLLLGVGIACIMLMPGMEGQLKKVCMVCYNMHAVYQNYESILAVS